MILKSFSFKKLFLLLVIFSSFLSFFNISARGDGSGGSETQDPLVLLNYIKAFDHKNIDAKFKNLLINLRCAQNVFSEAEIVSTPTLITKKLTCEQIKKELEKYENACLRALKWQKINCLLYDAKDLAFIMSILGVSTWLIHMIEPSKDGMQQLGASFATFNTVTSCVFMLRPLIRSILNTFNPPANPLEKFENQFAKNQCFIPKVLWQPIIEKFMMARTNQFEQRSSMNFLEFTLGLTTYKPVAKLNISQEDLEFGIINLFNKIDIFFSDYQDVKPEYIWMLKSNILTFIKLLLDESSQTPRYVYLQGPGGIGKTYFVNQLSKWIEEFIPNSVNFENLVITSPDELEGNPTRPGAMLRILRNQLISNKNGSVIFMDEATWLNEMPSVTKRVFNGDQSKISTTYFGNGLEGSGINLKLPPMLIFVASNEEIKDAALKTRFDSIEFPMPKKEKLISYAEECIEQNDLIKNNFSNKRDINLGNFNFDFNAWIEESKVNNFRDVASLVAPTVLAQTA
ncbi:hypothetical protein K9L05_04100 [Candidatus Babeliales bacterium]|nr:hypothetical protein [Candidatus Babeliales bacterium]MCF7899798.1 hypothetical protein [Candidatus Babeliales bacterium]